MRLGKIPFLFVRFTLPLPTENKLNHKTPTVMKKIIFTLIAMLSIVTNANAMSYEQARSEALFLTDKMAYELNLSDAQYEAAYEINLDYLMSVTNRNNVLGTYWERRNADLNYVLYSWQWELFRAATYFFRPLYWDAGYWHFSVYTRYPHRTYFYFGRPRFYDTYRGGHGWRHHTTSYYAHHHLTYRPHQSRDHHFGMRDGWNRGDYRNHGSHGHSSTHITGRGGHDGRGHDMSGRNGRGHDMSGRNGRGHDASGRDGRGIDRRGNTNGVYGNGNRRNGGNSSGRTVRPSDGTSRILTGRTISSEQRRVSGLSSGSFSRVNSSSTHNSGSFSRGGSSSSRATVSRGGGNGSGRSGGRR